MLYRKRELHFQVLPRVITELKNTCIVDSMNHSASSCQKVLRILVEDRAASEITQSHRAVPHTKRIECTVLISVYLYWSYDMHSAMSIKLCLYEGRLCNTFQNVNYNSHFFLACKVFVPNPRTGSIGLSFFHLNKKWNNKTKPNHQTKQNRNNNNNNSSSKTKHYWVVSTRL